MDSSLYAFVEDVLGDGVDEVLDRLLDGYGLTGLTVAASHHRARDVTPHGRSRLTLRQDGAHFLPAPDLFAGLRLSPPVQDDAAREPLPRLRDAARARGAALHGWTVFCRSTTLGLAYPDCSTESCVGDRASPADLCPANPDVREYAVALARNVARFGVDTVVAESLHFGGFAQDFPYERALIPLGSADRFLFGLCFCEYCLDRGADAGVDAKAARGECAAVLGRVLDGGPPGPEEVTPEALEEYAGPHTAAYVRARCTTVTGLVGEVAAAVADEGAALLFFDTTGTAVPGGRPRTTPAAGDAWRFGIDVREVCRAAHGYVAPAYAAGVDEVATEVEAYRAAGAGPLRVLLRPGPPDTAGTPDLAAKVAAVRDRADAVDFWNYGLATRADLDRIGEVLRGGEAG